MLTRSGLIPHTYFVCVPRKATNSTNSTSSNDLASMTNNLFGNNLATAVTQKDVNNYMIMAIIGTVIAVKLSACLCTYIVHYYFHFFSF
jgi:hypothetical protein